MMDDFNSPYVNWSTHTLKTVAFIFISEQRRSGMVTPFYEYMFLDSTRTFSTQRDPRRSFWTSC